MLSDVCYEDYMTVDEDYCGEYVSRSQPYVVDQVLMCYLMW
jgi:hypothetical protein